MKNIIYVIPFFALLSCGGSGESEDQETVEDSLYRQDHEWIVSANTLKEKFGNLQKSFVGIGDKEVEETICTDASAVPYNGNQAEMNIWMMSTYMLDNFSKEDFGQHDFKMPPAMIKEVTPLSELNWLNMNSLVENMFDVYLRYPDLTDIPRVVAGEDGSSISNEEIVQNADMALKAIDDGLFGVIAITDYLPPSYTSENEYETGYIMGYLMFADWDTGELSCISPLLAQNNEEIDFWNSGPETVGVEGSPELNAMKIDLQNQTFDAIAKIAKQRTGFGGDINVNSEIKLKRYKD